MYTAVCIFQARFALVLVRGLVVHVYHRPLTVVLLHFFGAVTVPPAHRRVPQHQSHGAGGTGGRGGAAVAHAPAARDGQTLHLSCVMPTGYFGPFHAT